MNRVAAATYVQISREELEDWLKTTGLRWRREEHRAGIYLADMSPTVAIKLSSTIGSRDDAMGRGQASMQLALISTVTGFTINKKAQGQTHFKRTTNWKTTWKDGIDRMDAAYKKSKGFYDALAAIKDRDLYKADILAKIESIADWQRNSMLADFHGNIERGGILTEKQLDALMAAAARKPQTPPPPPPPPEDPKIDEVLIARVRNLWRVAKQREDKWLLEFAESIGKRLKSGQPLSQRQLEVLEQNLSKNRLAARAAQEPKKPKKKEKPVNCSYCGKKLSPAQRDAYTGYEDTALCKSCEKELHKRGSSEAIVRNRVAAKYMQTVSNAQAALAGWVKSYAMDNEKEGPDFMPRLQTILKKNI